MEFGWIFWIALLIVWTVVALLVAYLFGGWARRGEAPEGIVPSKVRYLRRRKRPSGLARGSTESKPRRVAGSRDRH